MCAYNSNCYEIRFERRWNLSWMCLRVEISSVNIQEAIFIKIATVYIGVMYTKKAKSSVKVFICSKPIIAH